MRCEACGADSAADHAEIERLKEDHRIVRGFLEAADAKLLSHEKLLTECADALEPVLLRTLKPYLKDLIGRVRKATK